MNPPPAPPDDRFAHREAPQFFVFVKIPVDRHTIDPLHQREEQLDEALRAQGLGTVVGWGDSLGERRADGSRVAAYIRIDITVNDLARALALLRERLPALGASAGTEIHYTEDGRYLVDRASDGGWLTAQTPPPRRGGGAHTI
ncbi:MAG: hypothetical protein F9K35_03670 [Burkholderiaceae bacterium]|nr:MAG: hypothetical protein F9K35_03670 [Burkholderiaceae bacterium]